MRTEQAQFVEATTPSEARPVSIRFRFPRKRIYQTKCAVVNSWGDQTEIAFTIKLIINADIPILCGQCVRTEEFIRVPKRVGRLKDRNALDYQYWRFQSVINGIENIQRNEVQRTKVFQRNFGL